MHSLTVQKKLALVIINDLREATINMPPPMSQLIKNAFGNDPFIILMSCLLSLRARDLMTYPISLRLFLQAPTPQALLNIPRKELEKIIHSLGFFKVKAKLLHSVSQELIERFNGKVPHTEQELLSIKGIGRKTANLVLGVTFNVPAICVDTHVQRLCNQWGLVSTKNPLETEMALKKIIPKKDWIEFNTLVVTWGQNICSALSKKGAYCPLYFWSGRVAVKKKAMN